MEKKRVVVFDSDPAGLLCTASAVREWYAAGAEVVCHTQALAFTRNFLRRRNEGAAFDMAFIAVDDMHSLELAHNIRELDNWCPLFVVSEGDAFGLAAFRLHALDYLQKPVTPGRVGRAVGRIGMLCQAGAQWP